jgi:chaperonin GroES
MKIKPLADRIIVKPIELEVLAVGPGKFEDGQLQPMTVKVGNKVLYKEYGGDDFKLDGKDVVILKEEDILGVIE